MKLTWELEEYPHMGTGPKDPMVRIKFMLLDRQRTITWTQDDPMKLVYALRGLATWIEALVAAEKKGKDHAD